jgi:hypothetical protein
MIKVYIDQNVDQKKVEEIKKLYNYIVVQNDTEQQFRKIIKVNKAFTLDSSTLDGPDVLAGDSIDFVKKIIGKERHADIGHIYSAYINKCNYFITENIKDFVNDGKKDLLEKDLSPLKIRRLNEFIEEIKIIGESAR